MYKGSLNKAGRKHGKGTIYYEDGSQIEGIWWEDELNGPGVYRDMDSVIKGIFVNGILSGPAEEYNLDMKNLIFKGMYKNGVRSGAGILYLDDGGRIEGFWDDNSCLSGKCIYYYPDDRFYISGEWKDGDLVQGRFGCKTHTDNNTSTTLMNKKQKQKQKHLQDYTTGSLVREYRDFQLSYDPSDRESISKSPTIPDLYENYYCHVKQSSIGSESGQGLFASNDIPENRVISFYNGIKLTHKEVDDRNWELNSNTISLNLETVIDVPPEYNDTLKYCSSLGHKANHHYDNNAVYSTCYHPRFGDIKCIKSIKPIKKDEEILVNYGYSKDDQPDWYSKFMLQSNTTK
eukprot:gene11387-13945_t